MLSQKVLESYQILVKKKGSVHIDKEHENRPKKFEEDELQFNYYKQHEISILGTLGNR